MADCHILAFSQALMQALKLTWKVYFNVDIGRKYMKNPEKEFQKIDKKLEDPVSSVEMFVLLYHIVIVKRANNYENRLVFFLRYAMIYITTCPTNNAYRAL